MATAMLIPAFAGTAFVAFIGRPLLLLPDGCKQKGFGALGSGNAFGYTHLVCDGQHIVTFERMTRHRGQKAEWLVIDEVHISALTRGQEVLHAPFCSSSLYKDDAVMAVGRWAKAKDGGLEARPIARAWRFDLQIGKIVPIQTRGVDCSVDDPG